MLCALRAGTHLMLGFGSFAEYLERLFGYRPHLTQEKLRVAEALESLPELSKALERAEFNWSVVRELTRVATPSTELEWRQAARGRSVRQVERLVSGKRPGDRPRDPADPKAHRHVLRFDVSAEVLGTFRDAMAKLRRDAGDRLDDDAALLLMARHVLGGPVDSGRASYQVALTVCQNCRQGHQQAAGELLPVDSAVVEMAECDAQQITLTSATRVGDAPQPLASPADAGSHVGDPPPSESKPAVTAPVWGGRAAAGVPEPLRPPRAKQDIPPAVRRQVIRRDHGRCRVPGCRHSQFVDIHHIRPRAEGGDHDPENLVTLCSAHHAAVHRGTLMLEGKASELCVRHADGTTYGGPVSPAAAGLALRRQSLARDRHKRPKATRVSGEAGGLVRDRQKTQGDAVAFGASRGAVSAQATETVGSTVTLKVRGALRSMGFRDREARRALESIAADTGAHETAETLLRRALAVLV